MARRVELLRILRRRIRVTERVKRREKTGEKGMFYDVDGRRTETGTIVWFFECLC